MARYIDSEERAEENRSSAWTLFFVGGIGIIAIVLILLDVISLPMSTFSKVMFSGVLGALCLVFIIAGFVSIKKTKTYTSAASIEKDQKKQIISWCEENQIAEKIDMAIANEFPNLPQEEVYFKRYEGLKYFVFKEFESIGIQFLEHVVDDIYDSLFDE